MLPCRKPANAQCRERGRKEVPHGELLGESSSSGPIWNCVVLVITSPVVASDMRNPRDSVSDCCCCSSVEDEVGRGRVLTCIPRGCRSVWKLREGLREMTGEEEALPTAEMSPATAMSPATGSGVRAPGSCGTRLGWRCWLDAEVRGTCHMFCNTSNESPGLLVCSLLSEVLVRGRDVLGVAAAATTLAASAAMNGDGRIDEEQTSAQAKLLVWDVGFWAFDMTSGVVWMITTAGAATCEGSIAGLDIGSPEPATGVASDPGVTTLQGRARTAAATIDRDRAAAAAA